MLGSRTIPAVAVAGLLLAAAGAVGWFAWNGANGEKLLRPDDRIVTAEGKELYLEHCASCHGIRLEGQADWRRRGENGRLPAPPHDASGHTWHHTSTVLLDLTKIGTAAFVGGGYESDMPGFGEVLTDSQILAILSFIKSKWPAEIRERHDLITAHSEAQ